MSQKEKENRKTRKAWDKLGDTNQSDISGADHRVEMWGFVTERLMAVSQPQVGIS